MRVAVLHNAVPADAPVEDLDTLVQVKLVSESLDRLGHDPVRLSCTLDLAAMCEDLEQVRPDLVFNLVEALGGHDSLVHLPPAVLEALRIPYTGSSAAALMLTTNKLLAKARLREAGLPTPEWITPATGDCPNFRGAAKRKWDCPPRPDHGSPPAGSCGSWILKGVCEQGSLGLDADAVLAGIDAAEVVERLHQRAARLGRPCFAEQFIDGREFAVTLLAGPAGPDVHPPYEVEFDHLPPGRPRILDYRAKWRSDCAEYRNNVQRFDFPATDRPLLQQLQSLALSCWELFGLRGWARVDFRVDAAGRPWILEINANPCLSPDADFHTVLEHIGLSFDDAVRRILADI